LLLAARLLPALGIFKLKRRLLISTVVAFIHIAGVGVTYWYVATSTHGQAVLVWTYRAFIDFPFSLPLCALSDSFVFIHGIVGTIWSFTLVFLLMPALAKLRAALT
jgi:hypothetical protein